MMWNLGGGWEYPQMKFNTIESPLVGDSALKKMDTIVKTVLGTLCNYILNK